MEIIVDLISTQNRLDFRKYVKVNNYQDAVSYFDIISKLVKTSPEEVSDILVSTFLIKKIDKIVKKINKYREDWSSDEPYKIAYAIKHINPEVIEDIKEAFEARLNDSIEFNFKIISSTDQSEYFSKIKNLVNSVEVIEK